MQRFLITLMCGVLVANTCALMADELAPPADSEFNRLAADLGAVSFATRRAAAQQLSGLSVAELKAMVELPESELKPEVAIRLIKELEKRYIDPATKDLKAVSDILESLSTSHRLVLADGTQRILSDHWRIRVELARVDLEKSGAKFREGSFTSREEMRWLPGANLPSVQILIGEEFTGGKDGLRIIQRMARLTDPAMRSAGVSVWLLEGHKLTDEEYSILSELVGQDRIQERSRVALGIKGSPGVIDGVVIEGVTKGSSAADAKLQRMDRILAIVEPIAEDLPADERRRLEEKQNLRDFDDLVERLKKYRDGDVINLRVVRGAGFLRANPFGRVGSWSWASSLKPSRSRSSKRI